MSKSITYITCLPANIKSLQTQIVIKMKCELRLKQKEFGKRLKDFVVRIYSFKQKFMKLNLSRIQNGTFELYHNFGWGGGGRVLEIHTYIFQSHKPHIHAFESGLNSYVPQFLVCVRWKYKVLILCTRYSLFRHYIEPGGYLWHELGTGVPLALQIPTL